MTMHADSPAGRKKIVMWLMTAMVLMVPGLARAQVTPAAGYTPPDDTPKINVGATIFTDYRYVSSPTAKDLDGNVINPSSFNVSRAYINVTGNISHLVAFRITPDITRESGTGSGLNGSLTFRLKYAYAQFNLDDWMPKGTWVRFGMIQTPYIDAMEGIYRYRFQGTIFIERNGYQASADYGVSFRTAFPQNYGDFQVGFYNGEGYSRTLDVAPGGSTKAVMIRASLRPLPHANVLRGLRFTGFYDNDSYSKNDPRNRGVFNVTFEHKYANLAYEYLEAKDRVTATARELQGTGQSFFITPKKPFANGSSIEGLVRYDHMRKDTTSTTMPNNLDERWIGGVAYWFPKQGSVSTALMFDLDRLQYRNYVPAKTKELTYFLHMLIAF
ncbi:MAG: hypothetical protein ACM3NQ_04795 [Bacteroidales bacterium]